VTGPRDLAPFAREAAMRNFELTAELWQMILGMVGRLLVKGLNSFGIFPKKLCERLAELAAKGLKG
jgi:hypothetical protein